MADLECPSCQGSGVSTGLACSPGGCRALAMRCSRCRGAGTVSAESEQWRTDGEELRQRRVHGTLYRTLSEEGRLLGLSAQSLSELERGARPGGAELLATERQ